ncbi:MAG: hypothetical protein ABI416_08480 [Ginsengibacter sp.]
MILKEIRLQTKQLSSIFNFYTNIVELPVTHQGNNSIAIVAGASTIIFDDTASVENPFYHLAFNIPSNKLEEAFQSMQQRMELLWLNDYKSYLADFRNWRAKSFYFIDPAGNILEFIARFDLEDLANEPFSAGHIRNVSEIGVVIPAEDFDRDVTSILKKYRLAYFDKQPPMPNFRAVGNDEGLFIIVPENRVWFATKNTTSAIFPMEISFIENGKLLELKM